MLRRGRWKLTHFDGDRPQLFDLESDPGELTNLALRPEHRRLLEDLRAKAIEELRRTEAGFADKLPVTRAMKAERQVSAF